MSPVVQSSSPVQWSSPANTDTLLYNYWDNGLMAGWDELFFMFACQKPFINEEYLRNPRQFYITSLMCSASY